MPRCEAAESSASAPAPVFHASSHGGGYSYEACLWRRGGALGDLSAFLFSPLVDIEAAIREDTELIVTDAERQLWLRHMESINAQVEEWCTKPVEEVEQADPTDTLRVSADRKGTG